MDTESILNHRPKLTDGHLITPQPSIADIVREHYGRLAGEVEGRELANAYLDRIGEFAGRPTDAVAPEPQPATPVADAGGHRPAPDKTAVRTLVRALVDASSRSFGAPNRLQLEREVRRWATDQRLVAIYPALALTDAEGGLSSHDESQMSMRSILKGLVADGILAYDGSRYTIANEAETPRAETRREEPAAPEEPAAAERPEAAPQAAADPLVGIREVFREVGLDLKVGDVDLSGGISRISKGGSAIPLMTGLAGVMIGAIAAAEARRPKG